MHKEQKFKFKPGSVREPRQGGFGGRNSCVEGGRCKRVKMPCRFDYTGNSPLPFDFGAKKCVLTRGGTVHHPDPVKIVCFG